MYDNISLKTTANFANGQLFDDFCSRFGLSVRDDVGRVWHNYGVAGLAQNMGLRLWYDYVSGVLKLDFSLHKYWNAANGRAQINHNLFTVTDAIGACLGLCVLFGKYGIGLGDAVLQGYEFGLNVPISYFSTVDLLIEQLHDGYTYDGKVKRLILKDRRQSGMCGTQITKNTRVIYVLYNKKMEVKEKTDTDIQETIRVEVKHKRCNKAFRTLFVNPKDVRDVMQAEVGTAFSDGLFFRNFALPYFERVVRDIDLYGSVSAALEYYGGLLQKKMINDTQMKQYKQASDKYKGYEKPTPTNDEKIFKALVLGGLMSALV